MTERLYYTDPTLMEFEAEVVRTNDGGVVLDRTAFYPTSGGQTFDTGWIESADFRVRVKDVSEDESGDVLHRLESVVAIAPGARVRGAIDAPRRRDHMQQHTGQHLLSAVFIELFNAATVSFHMGDESCTIDLDVKTLSSEQVCEAEHRTNEIIADDVPVEIKFATLEEAKQLGVRKIPPDITDTLRLIEIRGRDLTACGGTHVSRTGEIGAVLLRKVEKVKQGVRLEFVCGGRAIVVARKDFDTLTTAAALFSSHIYDVPEQIRKTLDESKAAGKRELKMQAELAEFMAARIVAETPKKNGLRLVKRVFNDRDLAFIKLLAQKLAVHPGVVALLATTCQSPALIFTQSPGGHLDMGALMKEAVASLGGRGGGSRDMAQGGAPPGADLHAAIEVIAAKLEGS
ncbi:MAG: alanyl-tRNA editing protein [Terriglobales bacterium]